MNAHDVKSWILVQIKNNKWQQGTTLPSTFELSKLLNIKTSIINDALKMLVNEGRLVNYFADEYQVKVLPMTQSGIEKLESITEMIEQTGRKASSIIINVEETKANIDDSNYLNIDVGESVTIIERVRTANDEPVVYCIEKIPTKFLPQHFNIHMFEQPILQQLEDINKFKFAYAVAEIEPISYDDKISQSLNCSPFEALLLLKQVHISQNEEAILYSLNYFRSNKLQFKVVRRV